MSRIQYNVAPGELETLDLDEQGDVIGRTIYTPERFKSEREELPSAVVAAYEGSESVADENEAPKPVAAKAAKKVAAKAAKKAAAKTAVKKTRKGSR